VKKTLAEHLEFASRLFGSGEIVKAGQIWQAILKREPSNAEAASGLTRVREAVAEGDAGRRPAATWSLAGALGLTRGAAAQPPPAADFRLDAHLRDGRSLYDMGDLRGALEAWERALAMDPGHALAASYVLGVRRELGLPAQAQAPAPPTAAEPAVPSPPAPRHGDEVGRLLESGVKAFEKGHFEKAQRDWERAHALDPENGLAKGYLGLVRNEAMRRPPPRQDSAPADGRRPTVKAAPGEAVPGPPLARGGQAHSGAGPGGPARSGAWRGTAVQAPATIVGGATLDRRMEIKKGNAPPALRLLSGSRLTVGAVLVALLSVPAAFFVRDMKKDAMLVAARTSIREGAIKHAGQSAKTEILVPTVEGLCKEAHSLLASDPLRAYLLAHEALKRDRMDASAPKLMEEARRAMLGENAPAPQSGSPARLMAAGDLDGAAAILEAQLRRSPNDARTRESLARVSLLMARARAAHGDWEGARARILMGYSLFPGDLEWQARLRLLDYLRAASEDERRAWMGLLG
jgi:tetratricopeptide (TPR) repeat protein